MPLSTISQLQMYRDGFIGGGNRSTPKKITDLSQVTDKFYHVVLYQAHLAWSGFKLPTLVVIGTDCISSNISNYHTITATGPWLQVYSYIHDENKFTKKNQVCHNVTRWHKQNTNEIDWNFKTLSWKKRWLHFY
jgi:hypothetical protein